MNRSLDRISRQFSTARAARRAGLTLLAVAAFSMVGTSAWGYWTTYGIGSASASTGTLYAPEAPVARVTGPGTIRLTWNTSNLSNNTPAQGYYVARSDAPATKMCETPGTPIGVKSCDDTSVGGGTYTYNVTAVYGSWTATSVESNPIIGTTTTVTASSVPSVAGETVLYTATVTQNSGVAPPTGSVTFNDGSSTVVCSGGSTTLSLGVATCQFTHAGAGAHAITAVYSGNAEFLASTASLNQTVDKASTTAVVGSTSNPSVVGQSVTYTATVAVSTPGAGTPAGNVEFFDGASPIAACGGATGNALSGTSATCLLSYVSAATHTITARYLGSADFNASAASASLNQTVDKASTTAVVGSTSNPSVVGQSVTYTATVAVSTPGAGTPAGNVEFFDGASPIAACGGATGNALSGTSATCLLSYVSATTHAITAQYLGSADFNASAASASLDQMVNGSLTISTVVRNDGNQTVNFTGTGAAATTTITVTICALNSFPCPSPISLSTATDPSAGSWATGISGANLNLSQTYFAQATQGSMLSAIFTL